MPSPAPSTRISPLRRSARQRGSIYIAVLGAAMIITTLGVSALYLVRVQGRINDGANSALRAAAASSSMIEVARLRIESNAGWRTAHSNDTWVADATYSTGKITYKLVDERDGNLSNSAAQPVRLYGKATFGKAVRLMSVQLAPDSSGKMFITPGSYRQEVLP